MPIDVDAPEFGSPLDAVPRSDAEGARAWAGWWVARLARERQDRKRLRRLEDLDAWYRGEPPAPSGGRKAEEAFREFTKFARSNFAALVVEAPRERMQPRGVRTSADGDGTGDAEAWRIWRRAGLPLLSADVHRDLLRYGKVPVIVNAPDPVTRVPVVTIEDPRLLVAEQHPEVRSRTVAALKVWHDEYRGADVAYLYRPGRLDVAVRDGSGRRGRTSGSARVAFDAGSWSWDDDLSRDLPEGLMPVVMFENLDGLAEFEPHLDVLQRINHLVMQWLVIATLQAFRQRFIEGLPPRDDQGRPIDWNDVFVPGPDALWGLPPGASLKELSQVDLRPLLEATRETVKHLAAASRTPMHMLDPSGENQSAEGAALSKEGLVFKAEDRCARVDDPWSQVTSTSFLWLADAAAEAGGEVEPGRTAEDYRRRADLDGLSVIWAPVARTSLTERAAAAAQARAAEVPWRTRQIDVMGFSPEQVDRMEQERLDDATFLQLVAALQAVQGQPAVRAGAVTPVIEAAPQEQGRELVAAGADGG